MKKLQVQGVHHVTVFKDDLGFRDDAVAQILFDHAGPARFMVNCDDPTPILQDFLPRFFPVFHELFQPFVGQRV